MDYVRLLLYLFDDAKETERLVTLEKARLNKSPGQQTVNVYFDYVI